MATVNIGNLSFTHKGDYASGTQYVKNDVVYYSTNGNAYIAKQTTTGNAPTNGTYWSQFAAGSGGIWNAGLSLGSAGQIVQVNSGGSALEFANSSPGIISTVTATDTSSRTTTSQSFTKASNTLDLVVTPASTASKFLIGYTGNMGNNTTGSRVWFTIFRDSTNLAPNGTSMVTHETSSSGHQTESPCTIMFLDSPNTTSQITYSFQIKGQGATCNIGGEGTGHTYLLEF